MSGSGAHSPGNKITLTERTYSGEWLEDSAFGPQEQRDFVQANFKVGRCANGEVSRRYVLFKATYPSSLWPLWQVTRQPLESLHKRNAHFLYILERIWLSELFLIQSKILPPTSRTTQSKPYTSPMWTSFWFLRITTLISWVNSAEGYDSSCITALQSLQLHRF